jgi:trigger factor
MAGGPHAGKEAEVTVTVGSVKERELPEPDDEFAQLASEFDTIDELRANLSDQVGRVKRLQQAEEIRTATLDALLEQVDMPLPEAVVQTQVDNTLQNALHGLEHDQAKFAEALEKQGKSREEFDADTRANAEKAIKTQLLLDALADDLEIQVSQQDITERLVLTSQQYGIEPQQLLGYMQQNNQLPAMFADVRRGLTIAEVVEAATVTDTDGNTVDTEEFFGKRSESEAGDDGETGAVDEDAEAADAGDAGDEASSEEPSGDTK